MVFGIPMSHISGEGKMDQFVAPTTSDLTPANLNWWEILQSIVCLTCGGEMSLQHKPGLLHCAGSSWCWGWDTDWTDSFCKYCVSVETIMLKYINECISVINFLPHLIFQCFWRACIIFVVIEFHGHIPEIHTSHKFIHTVACLMTSSQSSTKPVLHTVRSTTSSFNFQNSLLS